MSSSRKAAEERLYNARQEYQRSLTELKQAPTNPDLKQRALSFGRDYSALTRKNKQVTIFDEVALSNDISAATAAAATAAPAPASSVEERLRSLEGLRQKELITDAEYAARRTTLIESV